MTRRSTRASERGTALLTAVTLSVVAVSLCAAMMTTVTSRALVARHSRDGMLAMELCDSGIALARAELASGTDLDGSGLGHASGTLSGAAYKVVSAKLDASHYRLLGTATLGSEMRTVESVVEVGVIETPPFSFGAFGEEWVTFAGGSKGDAWDSTLGTYASQAVNQDAFGNTIAQTGCDIASNGPIVVKGTGTVIDGNATPGVDDATTVTGGAKVDGSTAPLSKPISLPDIDTAPVYAPNGTVLPALKNYSSWTKSGNASWTAQGDVTIQSGGTITVPAGVYYVNTLKMTNNATLKITGPVVLYLGHGCSASSGSIVNTTQIPKNLVIFGLGDATKIASDGISLSAKDGFYGAVYAPKMDLTIFGGGNLYGSVVALSVKDTGGSAFHFDTALKAYVGGLKTKNQLKQISWRKVANALAP